MLDAKYPGPGGFTVAGCDTYESLISKFLENHNEKNYFDVDKVKAIQANTINRFLFSFGTSLNYKTRKLPKCHVATFLRTVAGIKNSPIMTDSILKLDSGGFQLANGALNTKDIPTFINMYYDCINNNPSLYDHAFILDVPPGPATGDIFSSYQQIEDLNRQSYQQCRNLPQNIKDKVIYIHHFRTPSLTKTWNKFLFEEDLADGYKYFGTGGIVSNIASDVLIPIILYTIPLSSIILYAKQKGLKKCKFHVLGGANFLDVFYHKLFEKHIREYHGIDLDITYDSSALFKGLAIGRFIFVIDHENDLVKMDIRTPNLDLKFGDITVRDKTYLLLNELAHKYNMKQLNPIDNPIYDKETGTFPKEMTMYLFFYIISMYRRMERECQQIVNDIYPLYKEGRYEEFDRICSDTTSRLNQGRLTKKQRAKSYSLLNSLRILENLDIEYNNSLVDKFMGGDDTTNMGKGGSIKW